MAVTLPLDKLTASSLKPVFADIPVDWIPVSTRKTNAIIAIRHFIIHMGMSQNPCTPSEP